MQKQKQQIKSFLVNLGTQKAYFDGKNCFHKKIKGSIQNLTLLKETINSRYKKRYFHTIPQFQLIKSTIYGQQYILNIFLPWIIKEDIFQLQHINIMILDGNKTAFDMINDFIHQLLVSMLIGSNDFFYTIENILYNSQKRLEINYSSLVGDQLYLNKSITRKDYEEIKGILNKQNFNENIFKGFTLQNKFRALGIAILKLFEKKQISQQKTSNNIEIKQLQIKSTRLKMEQLLIHIVRDDDELIKKAQIIENITTFDQVNMVNYSYFLKCLFVDKQEMHWNQVIRYLLPRKTLISEKVCQKQLQQFSKILQIIGQSIYNNQSQKDSLLKQGLITFQKQYKNDIYNIFLKYKISSSQEQLLSLLPLQNLTYLFYIQGFPKSTLISLINLKEQQCINKHNLLDSEQQKLFTNMIKLSTSKQLQNHKINKKLKVIDHQMYLIYHYKTKL